MAFGQWYLAYTDWEINDLMLQVGHEVTRYESVQGYDEKLVTASARIGWVNIRIEAERGKNPGFPEYPKSPKLVYEKSLES